jgi:hypothetical protein
LLAFQLSVDQLGSFRCASFALVARRGGWKLARSAKEQLREGGIGFVLPLID